MGQAIEIEKGERFGRIKFKWLFGRAEQNEQPP